MEYRYEVRIIADTKENADTVMIERLGHDEDYGFDYRIDFETAEND